MFARVVDRETQRSRERQALEGHHVGIPATGEEVDEVFVHIVLQVAHRVGDRHEVALVGHVLTVTKVEDLLTCGGVEHDVAVGGAHIHGVDRSHAVGHVEGVGGAGAVFVGLRLGVGAVAVSVAEVGADLEPRLAR